MCMSRLAVKYGNASVLQKSSVNSTDPLGVGPAQPPSPACPSACRRWEGGKRVLHEGLLYIAPIALFDLAFPRRKLPETAPSAAQLGCEVLLSLFLYDLLFTAGHLLCHKVC